MAFFRVWRVLAALFVASCLGACGQQPTKTAAPAPVVPKGIFTSTNDCAAAGKLSKEDCGKAVDRAVALHQRDAKAYKSLAKCSATEGQDRCDRTVDGMYRPRLQAFFITMSRPPQSEPLYPPKKSSKLPSFRSPTQSEIKLPDDELIVSASAMSIAHANSRLP